MRLRRTAIATLLFTLFVILWGAFVRATGSGAGCGAHWPLCNGEVVPRSPALETMIELFHRVTSGLSLLLAIGLAWVARRDRPRGHPVRLAAAAVVIFFVLEAAIGAGLVLFELVGENTSMTRALVMGAHLINTFLLLGALTLVLEWSGEERPALRGGTGPALLAIGLGGLLVLAASGGIAALGDTLFPATSLADGLRQDVSATAHLLLRLRVLHPVLAIVVGLYLVVAAAIAAGLHPASAVRGRAQALAGVVVLQLAFGLVNLLLLAPVWAQLVHLLLADLCLIALVRLGAAVLAAPPITAREPVPAA